ncbi:MAG: histidine kinase [Bacteroidota bacterium]
MTRTIRSIGIICLMLLGVGGELCSQDHLFQFFTTKDGLPSMTLYGMAIDQRGFLWIGSDNGLIQFDGASFSTYKKEDGLSDSEILGMVEDRKGRIWFWTYNKTACYFEDGLIYNTANSQQLAQLMFHQPFRPDYYPQYKLGADQRLYILSGSEFIVFEDQPLAQPLPDALNPWKLVRADGAGNLYLAGKDCYIQYSINEERIDTLLKFDNYSQHYFLADDALFCVQDNFLQVLDTAANWQNIQYIKDFDQTNYSYKLFSTSQHYWLTNDQKGILQINKFDRTLPPKKLLPEYLVSAVVEDQEGHFWFSSFGGGLIRFSSKTFPLIDQSNGLASAKAHSVLIHPKDGSILVGHDNGHISQWTGSEQIVHNFSGQSNYNRIRDIQYFGDKIYYIGDKELTRMDLSLQHATDLLQFNNSLLSGGKKALFFSDSSLYICTSTQLNRIDLNKLQQVDVIWDQPVLCGYASSAGKFYFGSNTGLYVWENGQISRLLEGHRAYNARITHIDGIGDEIVLLSTQDNGLLCKRGNDIQQITTKDGLSSNNCQVSILQDAYLCWVGTNKGLNKISLARGVEQSPNIQQFHPSHGLGSNLIYDLHLKDSLLVVGTDKGVNFLNPYLEYVDQAPRLVIQKVSKSKEVYHYQQAVTFPYDKANLQIDYTGISYSKMGKIDFRYRLLGLDTFWTTTTSRRVHYAGLAPGMYSFELTITDGSLEQKVPIQRLQIQITPLFWQRKSFQIAALSLLIVSSLGLIYGWMQSMRKKAIAKVSLKQKIAKLELQALQAQLNPHFISNTLNSIQHFVVKKDVRSANEHLSKFAALMRMFLEHSSAQMVKLSKELELLEAYLALVKLSHENRFDYHFHLPKNFVATQHTIPTMILQPLAENAIIHGLLPLQRHGKLDISIHLFNHQLQCCIQDNGIGRVASSQLQRQSKRKAISLGNKILTEKTEALARLGEQKIAIEYKDLFDAKGRAAGTKAIVSFIQPNT